MPIWTDYYRQVKRKCFTILFLFFLLPLFSCAGLDPRNVQVDIKEEVPATRKTLFDEALVGLGEMTEVYGSKKLNVQCTAIGDDTGTSDATRGEIPRDITEMIKSSLNAIGGRVTYIPYAPNYIINTETTGYPIRSRRIPDVVITGGITEFDRGLETRGRNTDLEAEGTSHGRPIGLEYSDAEKDSIASITLDFNLIDFKTMSGISRMQIVNSVRVYKVLSEKELGFTLFGPTFGLKGTVKKIQGRHAAVRSLVQLSMIQIVGKYLKLPYWELLPNAEPDSVVIEALKRDFYQMEVTERVATIQKLLLLNGYYVPISGTLNPETNIALQRFDNRYDPDKWNIDKDIFLNLYLSVPNSDRTMGKRQFVAHNLVDDTDSLQKGNENCAGVPSTDTIKKALLPHEDDGELHIKTRGVGSAPRRENLEKREIDIQIPFELNKYHITTRAVPYLEALGKVLIDDALKGYLFEIHGHTCNLGRKDYNLWLSQKRAKAVKEYLTTYFNLSPDQFKAVGYGMKKPKWSNETEKKRSKNRRVTLVNTLKPFKERSKRPFLKVKARYLRNGKIRDILPGEALTSRDNYFVSFTPDYTCYAYLFQLDSHDTITQLFPNPDFSDKSNPVRSGEPYRVPGNSHDWLFLDENKGEEKIILLAYPEPLSDPQTFCRNLRDYDDSTGLASRNETESIVSRGPKGIRQVPEDILFIWKRDFRNF